MRLIRAVLASALLASSVGALSASTAAAQLYPDPQGVCVLTPAEPNPSLNTDTEIRLVLSDLSGNPLAGVASTAMLVSQPGGGATVAPLNFTTDANGQATLVLDTGDTAGLVTIETVCGELSANLNIPIGQPPGPPNTGTGPGSSLSMGASALAMAGLAVGAVGVTTLILSRREVRSE